MVRKLGIKLIVMPIVAAVIAATIYASFGIVAIAEPDNGASVVMGIALILVSLILRYGAELEQKNQGQEDIGE